MASNGTSIFVYKTKFNMYILFVLFLTRMYLVVSAAIMRV